MKMKDLPVDEVIRTFEVEMSEGFARAFMLGEYECAEAGMPLSQLQQITMLRMAFAIYGETLEDFKKGLLGSITLKSVKEFVNDNPGTS